MLERFLDRWPGFRDQRTRRTLLVLLAGTGGGLAALAAGISAGLGRAGLNVSFAQALGGLMVFVLAALVQEAADAPPAPSPRKDRIVALTLALEQAAELVDELRTEIAEGERLAAEAREDADRYDQLRALKREEVDAVAKELGAQLRTGERRGIVVAIATNVATGGLFFALGLLVGG